MADRPILFQGAMIRALLAGTKTQTRRLVKPQPPEDCGPIDCGRYHPTIIDRHGDEQPGPEIFGAYDAWGQWGVRCPYGQPGDRLWVRETWGYRCSSSTDKAGEYLHTIAYRADDARSTFGPMPIDGVSLPQQRERKEGESYEAWMDYLTAYWRQWRPSIHMPRWASRITLEVTEVRVEQLQEISEADSIAEGIPSSEVSPPDMARFAYRQLWDSINGAGAWEANPWVWVVSFKRVTP